MPNSKSTFETTSVIISTHEISRETGLSIEAIVEVVEHGIVEPEGDAPEYWQFTGTCLCTLQRVSRLQRDLGLNWSGIALVLDLIDQRDQLQAENEALSRRLARFESR
jgi:chaperone modulatory protein CbpM